MVAYLLGMGLCLCLLRFRRECNRYASLDPFLLSFAFLSMYLGRYTPFSVLFLPSSRHTVLRRFIGTHINGGKILTVRYKHYLRTTNTHIAVKTTPTVIKFNTEHTEFRTAGR